MIYIIFILEPAFLEKIAKRQQEEGDDDDEEESGAIQETIIGEDGQEIVVTKGKRNSISGKRNSITGERVFPYDIMISYCHADKDLVIKVHKFLVDQGFKIWIDLDNMFGPGKNNIIYC
jgi:hypothetical protein